MKKSNSTKKALGAFKKLGAVALITVTIFFTACKQTGGGEGGKPKHAITFSVEGTNGTLKAKADGVDETEKSPISIEEGKTVTFTATPEATYRVKGWTLDGKPVAEAGTKTEYKHKVTAAATVKVSFESNSTPTPTKYTVTLNQTANGTVTASPAIPTDKQVAKDTVITFTAKANDGYKIGKWTVTPAEALQDGTGADGSPTAKVKIIADTTVSVSFEANSNPPNPPTPQGTAILTLDPNKLTIKVKAKTADGSDIAVEGCNETTLRSDKYTEIQAKGTVVILKGKITELICSRNQLTALNVQGCTSLEELYCSENKLTELNVQGLTALQKLFCQYNTLTELNVQGLTALKNLWCYRNKLTELNVQGLTALKELECHINKLIALDLRGLTSLQRLYCMGNQLNAQAMTKLLNALPSREASDYAGADLYTEEMGKVEGNWKNFTQPAELKAAFDSAKSKKWKLRKNDADGREEDI